MFNFILGIILDLGYLFILHLHLYQYHSIVAKFPNRILGTASFKSSVTIFNYSSLNVRSVGLLPSTLDQVGLSFRH